MFPQSLLRKLDLSVSLKTPIGFFWQISIFLLPAPMNEIFDPPSNSAHMETIYLEYIGLMLLVFRWSVILQDNIPLVPILVHMGIGAQ